MAKIGFIRDEEVIEVLRGLGYQTRYLDDAGMLCWVLYDRVFQSL